MIYSFNLPIESVIIVADGINNGHATEFPFNAARNIAEYIPLPLSDQNTVTIKQVIFVQPDGHQLDVTKPFIDFLGTGTYNLADKKGAWGTIC